MKKLSLLIALCMLLTIGGVYATWIYSGSQIDSQTEPFVSKMGTLEHDGNSGSYTFTNNSLDFSIEPNTQEGKRTTIVWGSGSMTLVFTPKTDITDADLARALSATIVVEKASETLGTYSSSTIYTINAVEPVATQGRWQHDEDAGVYYLTLTAADLQGFISVGDFHLPSEDEYALFKAAIQDVKFRVKVTPAA